MIFNYIILFRSKTDKIKLKISKLVIDDNFYKTYGAFNRNDIKNKSLEFWKLKSGSNQCNFVVNYAKLAGERREKLHKKGKLASLINPSYSVIEMNSGIVLLIHWLCISSW